MAIVIFEHHPLETSARLGAALQDHGHRLRIVRPFADQPLPPDLDDVDGLVIMGGAMNVDQTDKHPWLDDEMAFIRQAFDADLPMVGVCLGAQLIAAALGGEVAAMDKPEIGWHPIRQSYPGTTDPILAGTPWVSTTFHMHGQEVTKLPDNATTLASSAACKNQAFRVGLYIYAFQYHFEWNRAEIEAQLDHPANIAWMQQHDIDPAAIKQQSDEHYPMYRHLGDRLCKQLVDLIFPLDKRVAFTTWPLTSYGAATT